MKATTFGVAKNVVGYVYLDNKVLSKDHFINIY